ncbi:MAG: flippase [Lachnospiraceae bacterium]|nr:flippase [Lachnospiraceae bacterium]
MSKSIKKNYIYNVIYQMVILFTPLLTTPYISRVLGADGVGTHSYTYSISSYFVLVAILGTNTYGQREIAYQQDNSYNLSVVFWENIIFRITTGGISILCYLVYSFNIAENTLIALFQGMYIVTAVLDIAWFFQGIEEFKKLVTKNLIVKFIFLLFIFLLINSKEDITLYIWGLAFLNLCGSLSMWFVLPQHIVKVKLQDIKPFRNIKTIIQLFIPSIAMQVYTVLDKTMIGLYTDTNFENGYYEQAEKLVKMTLSIVTSLGTVMIPRLAYTFNSGDMEKLCLYLKRSFRFVWFIATPMLMGLIGISDLIVVWFFGEGYEKCEVLIKVFSFLLIAIGLNTVSGNQYLIPTKHQNVYTVSVFGGAIINLVLNLVLIPKYLSVGAAVASVCAELTIALIQLFYMNSIQKILKWRECLFCGFKYIISAGVMLAVIEWMKTIWVLNTVVGTFEAMFVGMVVYFGCLILLKDAFMMNILKDALEMFKARLVRK